MNDRAWGGPLSRTFGPGHQVGLSQSIACRASAGLGGVVEESLSLPRPHPASVAAAGGVVAVLGLHVVGQRRLGTKGVDP